MRVKTRVSAVSGPGGALTPSRPTEVVRDLVEDLQLRWQGEMRDERGHVERQVERRSEGQHVEREVDGRCMIVQSGLIHWVRSLVFRVCHPAAAGTVETSH
jgi:hypothetical protein